jgi:2-amino-4-hydroxy-6-hydroxymethyldihydropteridine diphosphokinase
LPVAYIGLGSNLGNRRANLAAALALLKEKGITLLKRSSILETDPVGGPPQNKFLNAVVKVETEFSPTALLNQCQAVEQKLGRVRSIVNGPRPIDLDILLYDDLSVDTPRLTIPHPRMFERAFVLEPLKEIEPNFQEELSNARHKIR